MTTVDRTTNLDPGELVPVLPATWWDRYESLLMRASDYLNPILVKEARQALRSRQFISTFFLMLAAGWAWSILGLAAIGPAVYYSTEGPGMLIAYHLILSVPLLVVIPYSAFYSLWAERQDRTHELVSITSLGATQILAGKMCGIGLQMMVYLSAIFPCLAFTYLLRGLDIFTIMLVVIYTCTLSLSLSVLGLLLGSIVALRQRQIAMLVFFALVLFAATFIDNTWTISIVQYGGLGLRTTEFWTVQAAFATVFFNFFAITFLAARSQLVAVSQNRSTALRWALVVAQLSLVAWIARGQMIFGGDFVYGMVYFSALYWFVAGMFLTSESPVLSERVKRDLPNSALARVFLTWFTPGPGTGYVFVIANMLVVTVLASLPYFWIVERFRDVTGTNVAAMTSAAGGVVNNYTFRPQVVAQMPNAGRPGVFGAGIVATSYLAIFLGTSALLIRGIRRVSDVKLTLPVLVNLLLLLLGSGVPWAIQMSSSRMRNWEYSLLQISNPMWTLDEICFHSAPPEMPALVLALAGVAVMILLLNLPALYDELKQVRVVRPPRVAEEDAELARAASPGGPKSPWD